VDHLLLHYLIARGLWALVISSFGVEWRCLIHWQIFSLVGKGDVVQWQGLKFGVLNRYVLCRILGENGIIVLMMEEGTKWFRLNRYPWELHCGRGMILVKYFTVSLSSIACGVRQGLVNQILLSSDINCNTHMPWTHIYTLPCSLFNTQIWSLAHQV